MKRLSMILSTTGGIIIASFVLFLAAACASTPVKTAMTNSLLEKPLHIGDDQRFGNFISQTVGIDYTHTFSLESVGNNPVIKMDVHHLEPYEVTKKNHNRTMVLVNGAQIGYMQEDIQKRVEQGTKQIELPLEPSILKAGTNEIRFVSEKSKNGEYDNFEIRGMYLEQVILTAAN